MTTAEALHIIDNNSAAIGDDNSHSKSNNNSSSNSINSTYSTMTINSRKGFILSTISMVFIISSSSPSLSSSSMVYAVPGNQAFVTNSSFRQVHVEKQTKPISFKPISKHVYPHLLRHQHAQQLQHSSRPLHSTPQKQNDEKRKRRRRKQHHLNNLSNRKRGQRAKTYKEIKEERKELKIMRDAVESGSSSASASASASASWSDPELRHYNPKHPQQHNNQKEEKKKFISKDIRPSKTGSSSPYVSHRNGGESQSQSSHASSSSNRSAKFKSKQQPLQHHDTQQRINNSNIIQPPSSPPRTKEEAKRSSDRISKAQQLLDDLTNAGGITDDEDPYFFVGGGRGDNDDGGGDYQSSQSMKASSPPSSTPSSSPTKSKYSDNNSYSETTKTVPDTYWYNGNLQEGRGDYVTRWARGMKVAEPIRKYDPIAAEKLLFNQPTKWLVRNIQIGLPLATWAFGVIYDISTDREEANRKNRARQLLLTISGLGPAIIKGGQALASRSDLMPGEYLEELQKLQDDVPRFQNELAFETVEKELGVEFDSVFELIGTDPVAAASIGQVYKARLRGNGDIVALKIQRPKCEEVIALDLYVLRWWSGVANILTTILNRDIDVQNIIDDFGELIYRELDYVAEAANAQRFSELYANQVKDVFVPKVYSELTTSKVLTMEWVEGFRLTDNESLEKYGLDRKKLVDTLVQCSLRQILGNGFFHADPHAGNLLVVPDGRLCYLDFGMMSYAGASQRNGFILAVVHIVNRDWDELVSMYQRLGFIPEGTDLKPIAIALEKSLPDALNSDISELNFKNVVGKLGDIMYTYPFSLPPFYISIIRCLGVLEGLAIQVDPQARIISEAYPYVASRVLTDTQGELQEALRRLALTSDGKVRWNRLERLLSEARESQGYDVSVAVSSLTDYLISDDGEQLLNDFADQIVEGVDNLSTETISYIAEAVRALAIRDEVAAVKAFRTLEAILQARDQNTNQDILREHLSDVLPDPTPSMKQFGRITTLLGARGSSSDPSKLIPIVRRLSQEPKIQRVASEILARLGELILSRSLRAVFGLPPKERK